MNAHHRVSLQPAYLLHRKPYRDTSLLLEAITPEYGRVGLVAKGARRPRSRLPGLLQPFLPLLLSWSGRGELFTLTDAEGRGPLRMPPGRLSISGFYLNELLLRLLPRDDPHEELFLAYGEALERLTRDEEAEWGLRLFEKRLLEAIGYGLQLTHVADSGGAAIQPDRQYCYHLEVGPLPAVESTGGLLLGGRTLLALAAEETAAEPEVRSEAKRLMRAALALYLGDRPLKSRELFRWTLEKE
jgi:DNA repair protein RecO (recombination protein O)